MVAVPPTTRTVPVMVLPLRVILIWVVPAMTPVTGMVTVAWPIPTATLLGTVATVVAVLTTDRVVAWSGTGNNRARIALVEPARIVLGFGSSTTGCGGGRAIVTPRRLARGSASK